MSLLVLKKFSNMCSVLMILTTFTLWNFVLRQGVLNFERTLQRLEASKHVLAYMKKSTANISSKLDQNCRPASSSMCFYFCNKLVIEFFWFFSWNCIIIKTEKFAKGIFVKLLFWDIWGKYLLSYMGNRSVMFLLIFWIKLHQHKIASNIFLFFFEKNLVLGFQAET